MTNKELAEAIYNLTKEINESIKALKEWQNEVNKTSLLLTSFTSNYHTKE